MKYYAVIDTNVIVSAMLKWKSVPGAILELTFNGLITPLINSDILKEYRQVLSRPKFKLPEEIIHNIVDSIEEKGIYVQGETIDEFIPDPKDIVFYEVVMEERQSKDAYLITGNIKHFPIKTFVVTPRQMLDIILADNNI